MTAIPFPLEIVMEATPLSLSASAASRERWKREIAAKALLRLRDMTDWYWLDERPVAVTIWYFPIAKMDGDVDNIVKPILDGMKAVVYPDDNVVERVVVQKFEPDVPRSIPVLSQQLAIALDTAPPVVYLRIDDDLSWRNAP